MAMHDLIRLAESFYNTPWAMADRYLIFLETQLLQALKQGSTDYLSMFSNPDVQKFTCPTTGATQVMDVQSRAAKTVAGAGGIGVLSIQGAIGHRASFMSDYFGWPTTERLGQTFQQLVDDPNVGAIVFDVNSPGGMASGNEELHQQILKNRGKKPI